ncbi:MAG: DNA primase [Desulfovibrio sp.]|nr:DNA primase [Desulfovibrio sp.]
MQNSKAIELIKERIDIAELIGRYVPLQPRGSRLVAPCPFHDETNPSFTVDPDGHFYCFGCGRGGDIFDFWKEHHGVGFREALEALAEMAHVQLDEDQRSSAAARKAKETHDKRMQVIEMHRFAQAHFWKNLASPKGADCRVYLKSRGVPEELAVRFGLGWALDDWHDLTGALQRAGFDVRLAAEGGLVGISHSSGKPYDPFRARLMFPIRDTSGTTIAFGGRIIDNASDQAKYVNTSDSIIYKKGDHLYGLDLAGQAIRRTGRVFVTEGYMDVLTMHQYGFANAVGGLGTALTDQQVKRILSYSPEVMLLYDGDNAGRKAALAASEKFLVKGAKTRVFLLPEGEDIDSLLRRPGGPEDFRRLQTQAKPALQFCMETMRDWAPLDAVRWCRDFVCGIQLPELVSPAISYLARHLGFDERELRRTVHEDFRQTDRKQAPAHAGRGQTPAPQPALSPIEEEILRCAVRYPDRAGDIANMGADFLLASPFAKELWKKIVEARPGEAGYDLQGEERAFWDRCRGLRAPGRTAPDLELQGLLRTLDQTFSRMQARALAVVLAQNAGNPEVQTLYTDPVAGSRIMAEGQASDPEQDDAPISAA